MALLALLTAASAASQTLTPSNLEMRERERTTALATLVFWGTPRWPTTGVMFFADPANVVALSDNAFRPPSSNTVLRIDALAPGTATIYARVNEAYNVKVGTVNVYACAGVQIDAPWTTFNAREREPVTIETRAAGDGTIVWEWFRGHAGDTREHLSNGPTLRFAPQTRGPHYVWVRVSDYCTTTTKEFRIDVGVWRRRSAR